MENEHAATKPQDDVYKLYEFYSILSATHGNRAVKILANLYGLTTTFGTNSVRTIGIQCMSNQAVMPGRQLFRELSFLNK